VTDAAPNWQLRHVPSAQPLSTVIAGPPGAERHARTTTGVLLTAAHIGTYACARVLQACSALGGLGHAANRRYEAVFPHDLEIQVPVNLLLLLFVILGGSVRTRIQSDWINEATPNRKWLMRLRWPGITLALLVVAGVCGACSTTTTARRAPSIPTVSIPSGWKTYTYGKAAIAVPSDWTVVTSYVCPEQKGPGTLFLGPSKNPGEVCPAYSFSVNSVTITPAPLNTGDACTRLIKVNGLVVYVIPCATNAVGITFWTVVSLGVQVAATQAGGTIVGTQSSTVVGRVLHTLHKA
jgi:hypothetical protein